MMKKQEEDLSVGCMDLVAPSRLPDNQGVILHIAGKKNHEVLALGYLMERASARIGLEVISEFIPHDVEGGGDPLFKLRVSEFPSFWVGDTPNVLVALDPQAYLRRKRSLLRGSALIYDSNSFKIKPDPNPGVALYPVPMRDIGIKANGCPSLGIMVALGVVSKLFGLSLSAVEALLREGVIPKGESQAVLNMNALYAGAQYAAESLRKRDSHLFPLGVQEEGCLTLSGNEARRLGALKGGCHSFFIEHGVPL
jgi:Pyruvate/2-oxoacid:ferredoxin oxidoreductase gamma subunit